MTRLSAVTYLLLLTLLMAVSLRYTLRMRRKRMLVDGETLTDRFLIALPSLGIFLLPLAWLATGWPP